MLEKLVYGLTVLTGLFSLIVLGICTNVINDNHNLQDRLSNQQKVINAAQANAQLYQNLVRALTEFAVKANDQEIRALLTTQGFNVPVAENQSPAAPAPAGGAATTPNNSSK